MDDSTCGGLRCTERTDVPGGASPTESRAGSARGQDQGGAPRRGRRACERRSPPASLRAEVCANDAYVLPAAWLDRCQILLDDESGASVPVATIWCSGAGHGIDGLPDTEHTWPRAVRGSIRAYADLPEPGCCGGLGQPLSGTTTRFTWSGRGVDDRQRSSHRSGETVGSARDAASRTDIVPDLRTQGLRLVLPNGEFGRTLATRVFEADGDAGGHARSAAA